MLLHVSANLCDLGRGIYAYIILENCNEMDCEERSWMKLAEVRFVIAEFVISGVHPSEHLFQHSVQF